MSQIIECIPNFSEGRRPEAIERILGPVRRTPGLHILDFSSDANHNRSVLTLAGDETSLFAGLLALFEAASAEIDLTTHQGEHPRLGAVDVVPFVPIQGVTMAECVALAKRLGAEVASRFSIPVFLYEDAASTEERKNLANIRKGEFEGLAAKMKEPKWAPDFGPASPHTTAGATVIGAREPLIAYNINLGTSSLEIADRIAKAIRHLSGGFRFVKAMGVKLEDRGIVQVSINMTNFKKTPLHRVFEAVRSEAERYGVPIVGSEIVGLVPAEALQATADFYLRLEGFTGEQVLENRLRSTEGQP